MSVTGARRIKAVVRQRCPVCLQGQVFRSTFQMLPACQLCGHRFETEPGNFRGTLAVSATFGTVLSVLILLAAWHWLVPGFGRAFALIFAAFVCLLLLPAIFRYARIIRAHRIVTTLERAIQ